MRKFTDIQKEHFKHLVLDCIVQRLTTQESLQYVKDKLGSEIGADHFNHVRAQLKQDVKKNLKHLQKDRFAYIREFFDRIEEIRFIQKRLWRMIEDKPDKPILQKSCLSELHQSTITLCNLYDALPAAISVRPDFVNGGYEGGVENYRSFHFDSNQVRG
ncbi:MAG: hypothetical protein WAM88_00750 [Nitrososphaeraceae archaeon]|jgi:hypothetical protein